MRASRSEDAASRRMGWWRSVRAFLSRDAHCNAPTCLRGCTLQCFDSTPRTDEISGSGRSTKASNDARSLVLFPFGCGAPRLRFSPATWRHIVCVTRGVALALAASCSLAAFGSLVRSLMSCLVRVLLARWRAVRTRTPYRTSTTSLHITFYACMCDGFRVVVPAALCATTVHPAPHLPPLALVRCTFYALLKLDTYYPQRPASKPVV